MNPEVIMNIIFFGSDDFALAHLQTLHAAGYSIVACVTQPDRPKGRGMKMVVSPIKQFALDHQLPILQPVAFDETVISDDPIRLAYWIAMAIDHSPAGGVGATDRRLWG